MVHFISDEQRLKSFENELNQFTITEIREWVETVLKTVPDDFWLLPPSSSGRYHPKDEFCEGGAIIHTKRVFYATKVLCDSEADNINLYAIECAMAAALLHDCMIGHGKIHAEALRPYLFHTLGKEFVKKQPFIISCIESHMGRWGFSHSFYYTIIENLQWTEHGAEYQKIHVMWDAYKSEFVVDQSDEAVEEFLEKHKDALTKGTSIKSLPVTALGNGWFEYTQPNGDIRQFKLRD